MVPAAPSAPPDPAVALVQAVKQNDLTTARNLIQRYSELRSVLDRPQPHLPFGSVLLMPAVRWENREMIDLLLAAGADINARSDWWAGGFGVLDLCEPGLAPFLVERGARVDAHAASRLGRLDDLRSLVSDHPELVHARGGDGQTPLHVAQTVEIAGYLLDHGAVIDALDIDHEATPAQYMVRDRQDVARLLVARGCRTDILLAASLGDVDLVLRHLEADPESIRTEVSEQYFPMRNRRAGGHIYIWTLGRHKTAHIVAREFGHEEVFRLLMDRSSEELKLAQACDLGDETIFASLLKQRPQLAHQLTASERRKLVDAAQNNNPRAVRLMLAAGWPVDARGDHNATALHFAAWMGNLEMVREILPYHPPLEARGDEFNLTPLGWALHGSEHSWRKDTGDYAGTVAALLQAGAIAPELSDDLEASAPVREVLRRWAGTVS